MRGERYLFPGGQEDGHRWKIALESVVTGSQVCKPKTLLRGALRWAGIGHSLDPCFAQTMTGGSLQGALSCQRVQTHPEAQQLDLPGTHASGSRDLSALSVAVAAIRPCSLGLLPCCLTNHSPPSLSAPVLLTSLLLREHVECSPASWPLC